MCIGQPVQVIEALGDVAWVTGRDGPERLDLRLIGAVAPGDWLLAFRGAARERLAPARAAEVRAALALLEAALAHDIAGAAAAPRFDLPSALDAAALAALTGAPR